MSAYIKNKNVFPLYLNKKHPQTISFENTLNVNSPQIINLSSKIGNDESLLDLKPCQINLALDQTISIDAASQSTGILSITNSTST